MERLATSGSQYEEYQGGHQHDDLNENHPDEVIGNRGRWME